MTDKVDCAIWIWDNELQRKKRIRLQTLLNRVNHTLRDENQTYFALEKDRDQFAKENKCQFLNIQNITKKCASAQENYKKKKGKEMPRNKPQASNKQQASSNKLETLINQIHDHWAFDNGYKAQAPSHKLRQNVARYNASDYIVSSNKPQAS